MSLTSRCLRQAMPALATLLLAVPSIARGTPNGAGMPSRNQRRVGDADPAIRRALALLQISAPPPIHVVDVDELPQPLRKLVEQSCAFVLKGVARIEVNSSCEPYQAAEESLLDAVKLAAILRHEMAHLDGADEASAREVEARTFRELLRMAPYLVIRGFAYAAELDRRAASASVPSDSDRGSR
jgi:hypothetical protein